ncbi:MAG: hypothetical protein QOI59_3727 [Gammaproteobacteria bacterium]|nr:hypothetical protein [Gammaproteobacteria bacterium]
MLTGVHNALTAVDPVDNAICLRLTGFVSFLRENGFAVGIDDAALLVEAANHIGILDKKLLRWSAQALLCRRAGDRQRFDELFDAWFLPPNKRQYVESRSGGHGVLDKTDNAFTSQDAGEGMAVAANDDAAESGVPEGGTAQHGATTAESLANADFRHLHQPEEMRALEELMRSFALRLRKLELRRERTGGSLRIDMAGTARRSVSHGGQPIELAFKKRRRTQPRLVLLLDVSRSMNLYSFFFLRLARALQGVKIDARVYIWHTRLSGITDALRDPDPWRAQERLQMLSAGWAGGTRIGDCLGEFEREHSRIVHKRTALIVVSDGYDTGDPQTLAHVLQRLRRRARRIVWLNPLAGRSDYRPIASGMQAALPHIDLLIPAHNFSSVEGAMTLLLSVLR